MVIIQGIIIWGVFYLLNQATIMTSRGVDFKFSAGSRVLHKKLEGSTDSSELLSHVRSVLSNTHKFTTNTSQKKKKPKWKELNLKRSRKKSLPEFPPNAHSKPFEPPRVRRKSARLVYLILTHTSFLCQLPRMQTQHKLLQSGASTFSRPRKPLASKSLPLALPLFI